MNKCATVVRKMDGEGERGRGRAGRDMRGEKKERDEMDYICNERVSSSRPNVPKSEVTTA